MPIALPCRCTECSLLKTNCSWLKSCGCRITNGFCIKGSKRSVSPLAKSYSAGTSIPSVVGMFVYREQETTRVTSIALVGRTSISLSSMLRRWVVSLTKDGSSCTKGW